MASNKKITDLDEISSITVADDDVLAIVDVSQDKTYKIRKDAFEVAISGVTSMAAASPLSTNASTGAVTLTLGTVPVTKGGTGGITATEARTNLGLGSMATQNSTAISVTGGSASGLTSVSTAALAATGTSTLSTVDINGGAIDGTTVGSSSPSTGAFTTLSASSGYTGNVTGNVTGNLTGNVTGNVTAATGTSSFTALTTSGNASVDSLSLGGTAVTSTAAELNILDGVTATASELNILDGVTASTAELNILDGVTASTAELNILDGVTATAAELNILDGVTATTAEINYLDGVAGTIWNNGNDALSYSSSNESSGYVKLPNGLYIQWGYDTSSAGTHYVTLPIAFPNYFFTVVVTVGDPFYLNLFNASNFSAIIYDKTKFELYSQSEIPNKHWIAIGI